MSTKTSRQSQRVPQGSGAGKQSKGGKKGRKSIAPVRVGKDRNWGPIAMFVAVGVIAAGIVGWAAFALVQQDTQPWEDRAAEIEGVVNWHEEHPDLLEGSHHSGPLPYEINPPAGGPHNERWQDCTGVVYEAPIATEHALHSMEHGAVWVTYDSNLPEDQVSQLASRVNGTDYTMLSPFEGLDAPISLQAWGFQLKVDDAGDNRIDDFIRTMRHETAVHDGPCSGGVTNTGTAPIG